MTSSAIAAKRRKGFRKFACVTFFVMPGLLIVTIFILLPLFMSLANSFFSWNQLLRGEFVGFDNFRRLFTAFPYKVRFTNAIGNNMKWFFVTMFVQNSLGLLFGYTLSRQIKGGQIYRRILFIPVLFSIVAVGFLWSLYMRPDGLINTVLATTFGHPEWTRAWLGDGKIATYSIIVVNIWRWVGFPSLVFMTACDAVSEELVEASMLDGSNEWGTFWNVIFPLIIPSITVISVLTIIGSLNVFEQVYTMAGLDGPPNYATDTISTLFYRTAFGSVDSGAPEIGMGSAIAVIIYIATFVISLFSIGFTSSKEVEM